MIKKYAFDWMENIHPVFVMRFFYTLDKTIIIIIVDPCVYCKIIIKSPVRRLCRRPCKLEIIHLFSISAFSLIPLMSCTTFKLSSVLKSPDKPCSSMFVKGVSNITLGSITPF